MATLKRCSGYKNHWACGEDYPDHMVPVSEFSKYSTAKDGLQGKCRKCCGLVSESNNGSINAVSRGAYKRAGGVKAFYALPKEERLRLRELERTSNVINFPRPPQFDNSYEEVTTVSKGRKRDQKVVNHVKGMYSTCSVEGCDYPLYDVAHIHALKHGADDLPGNCLPLCPNHHRDLDRGRLMLADPADRSATDPIEFVMNGEDGRIILDGDHEVDSQYINGCIEEITEWLNRA